MVIVVVVWLIVVVCHCDSDSLLVVLDGGRYGSTA